MFTRSEFEEINNEFNAKQAERRKKLVRVWGFVLGIVSFIIVVFIVAFPNQFDNESTAWILPTYGGILFLIAFIGFLISTKFQSEKPVFEYIYDEIIQKINMDEGLFLNYKAYDKEDRGFNKIGGLFTSFASVRVRRHISGDTEEHHHFNIYDCTMTTSSGNSQQTHFAGVYFVVNRQLNTSLQIRTNGSPKLKGVKFDRQDEFDGLKVYKEREQNMTNIDHTLLTFMNRFSENEEYKRVYLSVVDGQIHLALWFKKNPANKQKIINIETMNRLKEYFMSEYQIINDISSIDSF